MGLDRLEIKASSVDQAIEQGLEQLNLPKERVEIEIIKEGGLFSKAVVALTPKPTLEQKATAFLNELFELMKIRCFAEGEEHDNKVYINISGGDSGSAIGYRGEVLDALQYLTVIVANNGDENGYTRIEVDAENYREKRKETLTLLAGRLAIKANRLGKPVELEPMNPFERRLIHTALQDSELATTKSEGEGVDRHIVIIPKKQVEAKVQSEFAKKGPRKTKSFGYNKRRF